jgi:hypothetical protein
MPNADLKDKLYNTGSDDEKEKYTALAMQETRLKKAKKFGEDSGDWSEFNRLGGDLELKRIENIVHPAQNANYNVKKVGMDAGRENQFIKKHDKDRDNANPTAVGGIPKMTKGSIKDKIMTNKEVYNEEITKEISKIKYLMEYMNNNKKTKI